MLKQKGFTLVEILIAMFLGSVLLTMSTQVLIQIAKSNRLAHQSLLIQETGSLARQLLEKDIRRAGFFAGLKNNSSIGGSATRENFTPECFKDDERFSRMLFPSILGFDGLPEKFSCLDSVFPEGDVLVLRYLQATDAVSSKTSDSNKLYMKTSLNEGKLFKAKDKDYYSNELETDSNQGLYEVKTYIYHLRETSRQCSGKTVRALFREYNNSDGFMNAEEVVSGIVQMQFQYLHNGVLRNARDLKPEDWQAVESVAVDLLLASECMEDHDSEVKAFQLADATFQTEKNDAYFYEPLHFLVNLRNRPY